MSGTEFAPGEFDAVAAEYVLGVLDLAEMRSVRVLARQDPVLAAAIVDWEVRLAPLALAVAPQAPPAALWGRIEQRIAAVPEEPPVPAAAEDPMPPPPAPAATPVVPWPAPPSPPRPRAVRVWQAATAAALALAAVFAGIAFLPGVAPGGARLAAIAPIGAPQAAFLASAQPDGSMVLAALAPAEVPAGRDLELWILPPGAKTVAPLGVLPITGRMLTLPARPPTGTQLLISLEPRGGSPTGQPTGPVLYAGTLSS